MMSEVEFGPAIIRRWKPKRADLIGSFVVGSVTSNGQMNFHFDENLGPTAPAKPWVLSLWRELQTPAERAAYQTQLNF